MKFLSGFHFFNFIPKNMNLHKNPRFSNNFWIAPNHSPILQTTIRHYSFLSACMFDSHRERFGFATPIIELEISDPRGTESISFEIMSRARARVTKPSIRQVEKCRLSATQSIPSGITELDNGSRYCYLTPSELEVIAVPGCFCHPCQTGIRDIRMQSTHALSGIEVLSIRSSNDFVGTR